MNRKHLTALIIGIVSVFAIAGTLITNHGSENQIASKEKAVSTEKTDRTKEPKLENEKKTSDAGEKSTKSQIESKKTVQVTPSTASKTNKNSKSKVAPKASDQKTTVSNASKSSVTKPSSKNNSGAKPVNNGSAKKQTCHVEPIYETRQLQTGTRTVTDKAAWTETVVDRQAWDEPVAVGDIYVCNDCGQKFNTIDELNDHTWNVHDANNYHSEPIFKTIHHEAVTHTVTHPAETHQEPVYTTQQVQTGTENVCG